MTEFVCATTAFVMVYAVYVVFQSARETRKSPPVVNKITVSPAPTTPVSEPTPQSPAAVRRRTTTPAGNSAGSQVRDPVSGEVISMPTNYRFAKKWIKDALVTEGLLDRVYKPNELDDVATQKTRDALERFKLLPKYQA